jgi:hypothetical protein
MTYSLLDGIFYISDDVRGPVLVEIRQLPGGIKHCSSKAQWSANSKGMTPNEKKKLTHCHDVRIQVGTSLIISVELIHPSGESRDEALVSRFSSSLLPRRIKLLKCRQGMLERRH